MIRPLTTGDIPEVMILAAEMHAEGVYSAFPLNLDRVEHILNALIPHPDVYTSGAFKNGALIGAILGEVIEDLWVDVQVAVDHAFYVSAAHRGSPGGVKLIRGFEMWASQMGADIIRPVVYAGVNNDVVGDIMLRMGYDAAGAVYKREARPCA